MTDDRLDAARELHARMSRADRGTILHDELRKRRNRKLWELWRDDPERWTTRKLAAEVGTTQGTIYSAVTTFQP
jgi:hypothetical protein